MSTQPEALRLANRLENGGEPDLPLLRAFSAAELRRLYADREQLTHKITGPGGYSECAIKAQEEIGRLSAVNAELLVAAEYAIRRLQADIDDGSRPDQWTMQDIVHKLRSAIQKAGEQA